MTVVRIIGSCGRSSATVGLHAGLFTAITTVGLITEIGSGMEVSYSVAHRKGRVRGSLL